MSEMSQATNGKTYRQQRTLTLAQLDACLSNSEVQARFKRYSEIGRGGYEGPMAETDALEEALMDVYCGAKMRGFRLYQQYATGAHVTRLKRIMADTISGTVVDMYVPDLVGLRAKLRSTSDLGMLSKILVAEQSGRNDENECRAEAVDVIVARIKAVQDNQKKASERSGPTAEELAEVTSAT